ncbi:hypothetical protein NDU88_004515 [Pleurodeles waltl]|uniref:Uncharacterized protein n=1 Tax=Pleurodeles waltl TaxID=8319 RepID=A0AAV7QGE9_PLEWA|nr:hypothetical protein NDU88_004515 [Pleurodeles waltl]
MASNRVRVGKRKGTDPELAQLLKLVLAKLGGGDSDGEAAPSDGDDGEEGTSRPRRAHVAPPAAFPPVKRRNKKQTGGTVVQQPTPQAVLAPPPPMIELVTVVAPSIAAVTPSEEIAGPRLGVAMPSTGPAGGVEAMLADIRRSVAAPTKDVPTQVLPIVQGVAPGASTTTEQGQAAMAQSGASQDLTTQTLVSVSQMLANLTVPVPTPTPPPTTPWASDPLQNTVLELKRQVEALVAARNVPSLQVTTSGPCVSQAPGSLSQTPPVEKEHGKVMEQGVKIIKTPAPAEGTGSDTLLSRPGKLAAHVASEINEKIWKGDFVDIFSLVRAKRREIESKAKDAKASSSTDKKPKIEENITNWLFGFNVFMSVMLEKKPEIGMSMIFYANKILKAHHVYGGNAWLEYDRDFRRAKVEDPAIGWDQTEVNVWLECVNNKLPSKQPFRAQYSNDKKGSCWAFNRKIIASHVKDDERWRQQPPSQNLIDELAKTIKAQTPSQYPKKPETCILCPTAILVEEWPRPTHKGMPNKPNTGGSHVPNGELRGPENRKEKPLHMRSLTCVKRCS